MACTRRVRRLGPYAILSHRPHHDSGVFLLFRDSVWRGTLVGILAVGFLVCGCWSLNVPANKLQFKSMRNRLREWLAVGSTKSSQGNTPPKAMTAILCSPRDNCSLTMSPALLWAASLENICLVGLISFLCQMTSERSHRFSICQQSHSTEWTAQILSREDEGGHRPTRAEPKGGIKTPQKCGCSSMGTCNVVGSSSHALPRSYGDLYKRGHGYCRCIWWS